MGNYSKILVAFDGSESSRNALRQTLDKFDESWIKVLVVMPAYEGDLELVGIRDVQSLLSGPTEELKQAAQEIIGSESSRVNISVVKGEAFERIIDVAENESCTLIVMGRRGLHRVERMLMGSVTAKVIVHASTDVMVIPRKAEINWDNVIIAVDGSADSEKALKKAIGHPVNVSDEPALVTALGAALLALQRFQKLQASTSKPASEAASRN